MRCARSPSHQLCCGWVVHLIDALPVGEYLIEKDGELTVGKV
jgi:hypothetical protein